VTRALRFALLWIRGCALIVPRFRREIWRDQWTADLHHYALWLSRSAAAGGPAQTGALLRRASGALIHAVLLRINQWSLRMLSQDVKFACRMAVRRPAFTLVAILILGLGIGANATIFSWVESVLLQPIRGVDSRTIVALHGTSASRDDLSFSYPNFLDLRAAMPGALEDVAAFRPVAMSARADGEATRIWGELLTPNLFDLLRLRPQSGRFFTDADGAAPLAVISHDAWVEMFGRDPGAVGRAITLNAQPFTIVGVAPEGFHGTVTGLKLDIFVPLLVQRTFMSGDRLPLRGSAFLQVFGRLSRGRTLQEAQASLDVIAANLAREHPVNEGRGIALEPLWRDGAAALLLPLMLVLMAVVGVVLLIACANLAGLLLARTSGRQREVAVRLAVGASRARVVRQFILESALVAAGGGIAGIVLAFWTSGLLMSLIPPTPLPVALEAGVSVRVLMFAGILTAVTALGFGLLPALRASRPDLSAALKETAPVPSGAARGRLRSGLVVAQVALSVLLLVCAALFARGLLRARTVDPGFDLREGIIAALDLLPGGYDASRGTTVHRRLIEEVSTLPGVVSATFASAMPLDISAGSDMQVSIDGYVPAPNETVHAYYNRVAPGYFETMGIRIVAGRPIDPRDGAGAPLAVVINETMAKRYWAGQDAIGRTMRYDGSPATVVGIAAEGKYGQLGESPRNYMYVSLAQSFRHDALLIVRTQGDPSSVVSVLQATVSRVDRNLPLFDVRSVGEHLRMALFIPRMASLTLAVLGTLAVLLAVTGLYAVLSLGVVQRTREIGVRLALGATRVQILRLFVAQGVRLAACGLLIGLALAAVAARMLASQLTGVSATDPVSFAATTGLLLLVALAACAVPAGRAARVDPVRALRRD
jgi:predicted permease